MMAAQVMLVDRIMAVMEVAFEPTYGEAWNRQQVADALVLSNTHALVIDGEGEVLDDTRASQPAGFVLTRHGADEEELLLIAVVPDARGRGLGKSLIEKLFEAARGRSIARIFLEMRRGNPAEHLYRATGFEPIGERPNYYRMSNGSRVDAITFSRSI